jgi:predicted DNA-binding transcriptional regulator AlpA
MLGARPSRNSRKAHATKSARTPAPSIVTVPIAASDAIQLISKPELLRLLGVSYSSVFAWMRAGKFPLAREIGPGGHSCKIAWRADEVAAWLASRPQRQIKPPHKKGAPATERPSDSTGPQPTDRSKHEQGAWVYPPAT